MNVEFTDQAWKEFCYWIETDEKIFLRIKNLINAIRQNPFGGIGKPEPLRYDLKGFWSRRITGEHRLVYRITGKRDSNQSCDIVKCRFHYEK